MHPELENFLWKLTDEQWAEFMGLLDRAPRDCPKLRELFNRPTVFQED